MTLFFIVLVNFIIVNLAPGDPVTISDASLQSGTRREERSFAFGSDDRYLQFREFYGLTLPILFNTWPFTDYSYVEKTLWQLVHRKSSPQSTEEMNYKDYDSLRINFGDGSRFIIPFLLDILSNVNQDLSIRKIASKFVVRGFHRQPFLGPNLKEAQHEYNQKIEKDNVLLQAYLMQPMETKEEVDKVAEKMKAFAIENQRFYDINPTLLEKLEMFFMETRFFRYMSRVLTFDFGTLRNDSNKTVVSEVTRRFKYSLTLAILPMFMTFFLCQVLGFTMAYFKDKWPDYILNLFCLILYATPVFVVAPFLIEKVALNNTFPFTNVPIPISGFTSPDEVYNQLNSWQRLLDVLKHIALPLVAVMYGGLAAEARLSRTAVLETLHQDYVRTAKAKGLSPFTILTRHVGRNAGITIVTSIAGSLGIILGGSLIVETLFEINGFGKFFYDAIVNRDYNVIMFSALAGSFLTLVGYLVADITYTILDPRITFD